MAVFKRIPGGRIGNFLAGAAVASVIGGTAVAITSPNFTYSAEKTGYFSISPMGMAPSRSGDPYFIDYVPPVLGGGASCHQSGVNLPHGAKLVSFTTFYRSDASSDLVVYFVRHNPASDAYSAVQFTVPDNSNNRKAVKRTVAAGLATINNAGFTYGYGVCIGNGTSFYGARFVYSYRSAGD